MDNKEKNIVDKFLDTYDKYNSKQVEYRRVYIRPTKVKSVICFIFSLIFFILLLTIFTFNFMYFLLFFCYLVVLIYFGSYVFTDYGLCNSTTIEVSVNKEKIVEKKDKYRVQ